MQEPRQATVCNRPYLSSVEKFYFAPFFCTRVRQIVSIINMVNVIHRYCKDLTVTS